ncbi:hypothetical protein [Fervidobacterium sp.]
MKGKGKAVFLALLVGLSLILAACGGGASVPTENASVGTYNYGGSSPGIAVIIAVHLKNPTSPDGMRISVKDPQGNELFSGATEWKITLAVKRPFYAWRHRGDLTAFQGGYTVSVDPPLNRSWQITVDPTKFLDRPQPELSANQTSATISWSPVPGAKAYYVELWRIDSQGNPQEFIRGWTTNQTSVQFNQLNLPQSTYYRAWVRAFEADLVDLYNLPAQLGKQVNASVRSTSVFQVQSLGTLRILDHLPNDVPPPDMER